MFKILIITMMLSLSLMAKTFNFSELKYSDAIGKTSELKGQITFFNDGLNIFYPKLKRVLDYSDETLVYKLDGKEVELGFIQKRQLVHYFDVLILLHSGDESSLDEMFDISRKSGIMILTPTTKLKDYIDKIELFKENKILEYVKLFLKNKDSIMITIHNEI